MRVLERILPWIIAAVTSGFGLVVTISAWMPSAWNGPIPVIASLILSALGLSLIVLGGEVIWMVRRT